MLIPILWTLTARENTLQGLCIVAKDIIFENTSVNITVNKNTIPFDTNKPFVASGIRLGTPALTTRGMKETEMRAIGDMIASVIREPESDEVKAKVKHQVAEITAKFPMYPDRSKEKRSSIGG